MRFGELCLGLAIVMAGGLAHADKMPDPAPETPAPPADAKPPVEEPPAETPAEPEPVPTFTHGKTGPTQDEIDDMTPLTPPPPPWHPQHGFSVGLALSTMTHLTNQLGAGTELGGKFWLGRHGETFTWGIGFQFTRASHYNDADADITVAAIDESYTTFVLEPNISMILTRTKDEHTELLLHAQFGYGFSVFDSQSFADYPDTEIIRFGIAPELRHWVTDTFAIGAHVGPTWEHRGQQSDRGDGTTSTETFSSWDVDAALQMMAVF